MRLKAQLKATSSNGLSSIEHYRHKNWNLTFRYSAAKETSSSILILIHPVGIGLNSWFWEKIIDIWQGSHTAILAPDLIGCGTQNGGDEWNPEKQALSFPLGWVEGVETLLPRFAKNDCTLIVQGGLAPVGVLLAARNPDSISRVVFASPPTWKDMITDFPSLELQRNFEFLTNPFSANLSFTLLEQQQLIRFFSNQFLFAEGCDEKWLQCTAEATSKAMRLPVAAFNAGLVNHRSFEKELTNRVIQPTLVLSGCGDKRDREEYTHSMQRCQWKKIPGRNVLPWENPLDFCTAIEDFISDN